MADRRARIQVEDVITGEWATVLIAVDEGTASDIVVALQACGVEAQAACGCGSYCYGECEACTDPHTPASTTIDHITPFGTGEPARAASYQMQRAR